MSEELQQNQKPSLPNAVAVLVLGICSIVFSCAFAGLACGIVGLVISFKGMKLHKENPEMYINYGMLNAGKIMSIIGICLGGLYVIYFIALIVFIGTAASTGIGIEAIREIIDVAEDCRMAI